LTKSDHVPAGRYHELPFGFQKTSRDEAGARANVGKSSPGEVRKQEQHRDLMGRREGKDPRPALGAGRRGGGKRRDREREGSRVGREDEV